MVAMVLSNGLQALLRRSGWTGPTDCGEFLDCLGRAGYSISNPAASQLREYSGLSLASRLIGDFETQITCGAWLDGQPWTVHRLPRAVQIPVGDASHDVPLSKETASKETAINVPPDAQLLGEVLLSAATLMGAIFCRTPSDAWRHHGWIYALADGRGVACNLDWSWIDAAPNLDELWNWLLFAADSDGIQGIDLRQEPHLSRCKALGLTA